MIRSVSIRAKLIVVVMVTTVASLLLVGLTLGVFELVNHRRTLRAQMAAVSEIIAANSTAALAFRDQGAAREILRALEPQREIRLACLYDARQRLFASFARPHGSLSCPSSLRADARGLENDGLLLPTPVLLEGERIGTLSLVASQRNMWRSLALFGGILSVTLLAALGVGLLASSRLRGMISLPILELASTARRVSENNDYSLRSPLHGDDEIGVAVGAFNLMLGRIEHAHAALRLAESKSREQAGFLASILETMGEAMVVVDREGKILVWNAAATRMVGPPPTSVPLAEWSAYFKVAGDAPAEQLPADQLPLARALRGESLSEQDLYLEPTAERGPVWLTTSARPLREGDDRIVGAIAVFRDVTLQKQAERDLRASEAQLRQAQKMEAVGQLAGGIAHDFNNLLTVICGYSSLVLGTLPADAPRADLQEVLNAGQRAATLTRQLLAFSRRQVLAPQLLDLNDVVRASWQMLRRVISENVDFSAVYEPSLGLVRADPGQLDQVLLNLVVNARDAMPTGGTLTIRTENVELDESYVREHVGARPGPHVKLSISDNGTGMPPEVQARIFEPFFTTKEVGTGTGLGLSTVYGIVQQSGGYIEVASTLGQGTTFSVLLPRVLDAESSVEQKPTEAAVVARGTETILLVEDEVGVRSFAKRLLTGLGYTVLSASDGREALELQAAQEARIDLLLSDAVMPNLSGGELARRLTQRLPGLAVVFFSGYAPDASLSSYLPAEAFTLIAKPFTREVLARTVREALNRRRSS